MALLTAEVPGHVRRIYWNGVAIGFEVSSKINRGSDTKKIAHKDINPNSLSPVITKERVIAKTLTMSADFYFKESGTLATLRTAYQDSTESKVRMATSIAGNSYEEYDGIVKSLSDDNPEEDLAKCSVEFSCYGTMATGTTT